jgi:hypothetical protein
MGEIQRPGSLTREGASRIRRRISATAAVIPQVRARATIECPIFTSSIKGSAATGVMFA